MNETNIKHGYSLMVCDARGAILNPGALISKAGQGRRGRIYTTGRIEVRSAILGPQGAGFF